MARMRESEETALWIERIENAENRLRKRVADWKRYVRYYRQDLTEEEDPQGDSVHMNYLFGYTRTILPNIYFRNPDVVVSPRPNTPPEYAKMLERLLNYQLRELRFEWECRRVIVDAFQYGLGAIKLGHAATLDRKLPKTEIETIAEFSATSFLDELFIEDETLQPKPSEPYDIDSRINTIHPFAIRIRPGHLLIDPIATCLQNARWVVHCVPKTVTQVKESKRYLSSLTSDIQGNYYVHDEDVMNAYPNSHIRAFTKDETVDEHDQLVMLYEIWDREKQEVKIIDSWNMLQGQRKFLRKEANPYDIDDFPIEILVLNEDPMSIYGISDYSLWINPAASLNLLNTMHYNHVKRFHRKYAVQEGILDDDEEAKLTAPVDGMIVHTKGDPSLIVPIQDAPITPDLYSLREVIKNDLTFLSGSTEERRSGATGDKTATEVSVVEQNARIRDSDRVLSVSDFVERVVRKLLQIDRGVLDTSYVSFVTTAEEATLWQEKASEIIKSEVDVTVTVGSSAYNSRDVKVKQMLDFLNLTANLIDPLTQLPLIDVKKLIYRIAQEMNIPNFQELFVSPTPVATQEQRDNEIGLQGTELRSGGTNLGALLSGVQNLGVRRTAPNPTSELAR